MHNHLISGMVFLPLFGAFFQALFPRAKNGAGIDLSAWIAVVASGLASIIAIAVIFSMHPGGAEPQFVETLPWIGSYAITYQLGIDGLSILPILLIAILFPVLIAAEWKREPGRRGMHGLFLVLQSAFFGAACAQDLFLLLFFWGITAVPFYFLIGIWGGEKKESAAFHSIVASVIGNGLLFAALVLIYYSIEPHTFLLSEISGGKYASKSVEIMGHDFGVSTLSFFLICGGLAFRAPVWPIHGWFMRVAEEAPSSVFVIQAAAVIPMAVYVFIRLCYSLFPETVLSQAPGIVILGTINILVGGVCAISQKRISVLLAYICLTEVGLMMMGMGSLDQAGVIGAVWLELGFGLAAAGLGLFSGIATERSGSDGFFGGVATRAPVLTFVVGVLIASFLGFPGTAGFVGHSLVVLGTYSAHPGVLLVAAFAGLLATYYLFSMYRRFFLGKGGAENENFFDLTIREKVFFFPLVFSLLFVGIYPKPLLDLIRPTVITLLSTVR